MIQSCLCGHVRRISGTRCEAKLFLLFLMFIILTKRYLCWHIWKNNGAQWKFQTCHCFSTPHASDVTGQTDDVNWNECDTLCYASEKTFWKREEFTWWFVLSAAVLRTRCGSGSSSWGFGWRLAICFSSKTSRVSHQSFMTASMPFKADPFPYDRSWLLVL